MKAQTKTAVALCVCAALTTAAGAAVRDQANDESPFAMQKLAGGYMLTGDEEHKDGEGTCGEGSCGADNKDEAEGSCGEGSCGADNKDHGDDKDEAEGACGEGSCGGQI